MSASSSTTTSALPLPTELRPDPRFARPATEEQIRTAVAALERNGIRTIVASTRAEAVRTVLDLVPPGAEVMTASSQTLLELGLTDALADASRFQNLRGELTRLRQENRASELRKLGAAPDVVVGSVHAITEQGQIVVASATGSQLGPYVYGGGKVIWVAGTQKIVHDLDAAFERIEKYTFPLENDRALRVYGMGSSLAKLLVVNREFQPGRITLVLVPENLGF